MRASNSTVPWSLTLCLLMSSLLRSNTNFHLGQFPLEGQLKLLKWWPCPARPSPALEPASGLWREQGWIKRQFLVRWNAARLFTRGSSAVRGRDQETGSVIETPTVAARHSQLSPAPRCCCVWLAASTAENICEQTLPTDLLTVHTAKSNFAGVSLQVASDKPDVHLATVFTQTVQWAKAFLLLHLLLKGEQSSIIDIRETVWRVFCLDLQKADGKLRLGCFVPLQTFWLNILKVISSENNLIISQHCTEMI